MTFTMTIDSSNAAFEDEPGEELAGILRIVAAKVAEGYTSGPLYDTNGNRVGSFDLDAS